MTGNFQRKKFNQQISSYFLQEKKETLSQRSLTVLENITGSSKASNLIFVSNKPGPNLSRCQNGKILVPYGVGMNHKILVKV